MCSSVLCVVDFTCACVSTVRLSVCAVGIPACVECGSYGQVGRERGRGRDREHRGPHLQGQPHRCQRPRRPMYDLHNYISLSTVVLSIAMTQVVLHYAHTFEIFMYI